MVGKWKKKSIRKKIINRVAVHTKNNPPKGREPREYVKKSLIFESSDPAYIQKTIRECGCCNIKSSRRRGRILTHKRVSVNGTKKDERRKKNRKQNI